MAIHRGQGRHHSFDAVNWTRNEFLWHLHCDARLTPLLRHCSASTLQPPTLPIPTFPEPAEAVSPLPPPHLPLPAPGTLIHSANTNFIEHLPAPCAILGAGYSLRKRDRMPGSVVGHSLSPCSKSNRPSELRGSCLPFSSGFLFCGFRHCAPPCWIIPISKPHAQISPTLKNKTSPLSHISLHSLHCFVEKNSCK